MNTTLRTASGGSFDAWAPKVSDFDPYDVAHHLANECRFGGAPKWFYSVAQHSVLASLHPTLAGRPRELVLAVLLHDASEFILKDIPSPHKPHWKGYKKREKILQNFIYDWFDIGEEFRSAPIIKKIDQELFHEERRYLFQRPRFLAERAGPWGRIDPWDREYARAAFSARLDELFD